MVSKETLINTITSFDKLRTEKNAYLKTLSESKDSWSLEEFQKWQKMEDAWRELELVIEHKLLPFVENTDTTLAELLQVETLQVETLQVETLQVETLQVETLQVETLQVETLQVETLQVIDTKIVEFSKRSNIAGGTYITFLTKDTIDKDSYVEITVENRKHYFQVKSIQIEGKMLRIIVNPIKHSVLNINH